MPVKTVDAATLNRWLEKGEAALIDVREPAEHRAQHIPKAALVPLSTLSCAALPKTAGQKLVVHCKAGRRGETACEKLLKENPALELYNLEGGIGAWEAAGLPTQKSGNHLPIDRQMQLIAGLLVLTGVGLGYFIAPAFFLISAFVGAGLAFAGLTGFCGLMKLLAVMPWNK